MTNGDVHDYAPPAWVRWSETFWSLHGPTLDRGHEVLEVACARGETLLRLSPFAGRIVGVEDDAADRAVAEGRVRGKPGLAVLPWGGLALPFPAASFDAVFVDFARPGFVVRDRAFLLADVRRVLRPDGRLLALALADADDARLLRAAWTDRLFELDFALDELPPLLAAATLVAELEGAGFVEPKVSPLGPLLEILADAPPDAA